MLQLLLVGNNVLKLWWDGCVLVGLALARPSKALPASKPENIIMLEETVSILHNISTWENTMRKNCEEKL